MEPLTIALGFSPYFAGRPLLATFVVAAAYATGLVAFDRSRDLSLDQALAVIIGFGLLAVAEAIWKRVAAYLRELADGATRWIRRGEATLSGVAAVLVVAFVLGAFESGMQASDAVAPASLLHAGIGADTSVLVLGAPFLLAYGFAWVRSYVVDTLDMLVPPELGISRVVGFAEVFLTAVGVALALVLPALALAITGALVLAAVGVVLTLRGISRGERALCATCSGDVHVCAPRCGRCGAPRAEPRSYGLLGPARTFASDPEMHRFTLLARRRCPHCAEALIGVGLDSRCERCQRAAFDTEGDLRELVRRIDGKVLRLLPFAIAAGLIPGAGWAIGLFVFKLSAANALAGYVPWHGRLWTRLVRGALLFVAGLLQLIPFVGAVVVPVTLGAMHLSSRGALALRAREPAVAAVAPQT